MKIRNKITLYFSVLTQTITGLAFIFIYYSFTQQREEEFQMRQKDKISMTLELLSQIQLNSQNLLEHVDLLSIHDLFDEKLLLFDSNKQLIYSSLDDVSIKFSSSILNQLTPKNKWIETKDGLYDVIGTYTQSNGKTYYGISKAYDTYGYSKLRFLKYILIITFILTSLLLLGLSNYLSQKITAPLVRLTNSIKNFDFKKDVNTIELKSNEKEVTVLAEQFNKLMSRIDEGITYQKHAVHHISHELKTPISVLVSNFERMEQETDLNALKMQLKQQKENTRNLSEIINALLQIAKIESGAELEMNIVRVDELIFDIAEELKIVKPTFTFHIDFSESIENEKQLEIKANPALLKAVFLNLMQNCVHYSSNSIGKIYLSSDKSLLRVAFENEGTILDLDEQKFLFQHFFRGHNSSQNQGFGLGLVLVNKIIQLHQGTVTYSTPSLESNQFTIVLPLR